MTLQERLMGYATRKLFPRLTPREFAGPWTYVYREWMDTTRPKERQKCAECVAVLIDLEDGTQLKVTVADMQAEEQSRLQKPPLQLAPGELE